MRDGKLWRQDYKMGIKQYEVKSVGRTLVSAIPDMLLIQNVGSGR
jgi:hypothetical protein